MPNPLTKFRTWLMKSLFNDPGFASGGGIETGGRGHSGRVYWVPGTRIDWDTETGDLWEIPAVQACMRTIYDNFCQAPATVYKRDAEGKFTEAVANHNLTNLLAAPNPEYDGLTLLMGILFSWEMRGDVFIGIERSGRTGVPVELWWLPHFMVTPKRDKTTGKIFYEYRVGGKKIPIPVEDMVHVRYGIDPYNPLRGLSTLLCGVRDGYVLQQSSTYAAKGMRNTGLLPGMFTPKEDSESFDPVDWVEKVKQKTTGDEAGAPLATTIALEYTRIGLTPQELTLETLPDRHESNISALIGVPPQVAGLHVGRLSKTYANMKEAREMFWEEKMIPTGRSIYGQIGRQLLPQMSRNADNEILYMDISEIRPLQPDLDALHARALADWEANLIDRAQWKQAVGMKPEQGDKGVFYQDTQPKPEPAMGPGGKPTKPKPAKSDGLPDFLAQYALKASMREQAYKLAGIDDDDDYEPEAEPADATSRNGHKPQAATV